MYCTLERGVAAGPQLPSLMCVLSWRHSIKASGVCVQELRDKAEELVRKDPNKYVFRNIHVAVLLRRTRRRQSVDTGR